MFLFRFLSLLLCLCVMYSFTMMITTTIMIHGDDSDDNCYIMLRSVLFDVFLFVKMALCAHRYCAKLPSDTFTHLTPKCRIEAVSDDDTNYQAVIRLPINSPVKYPIKVSECFC